MSQSPPVTEENDTIEMTLHKIFPDWDNIKIFEMKDKLEELGAESTKDLQIFKEDDLLKSINVIQSRKIVAFMASGADDTTSNITVPQSPCSSSAMSSPMSSPITSRLLRRENEQNLDVDCLPDEILEVVSINVKQDLIDGKPLSTSSRLELIRAILAKALARNEGKKLTCQEMKKIAAVIVQRFPDSLEDRNNGIRVSTGSYSVYNQILCRHSNIFRSSRDGTSASRRAKLSKSYGCKADEYKPKVTDEDSYTKIRANVAENVLTNEMKELYPQLMTNQGMLEHFQRLTGSEDAERQVQIETQLEDAMFFFHSCQNRGDLQKALQKFGFLKVPNLLFLAELLCIYFSENYSLIYASGDLSENEPLTPFIHGVGSDEGVRYSVYLDGIELNGDVGSATDALVYMFSTYYVFGVTYPDKCAATLEYIQRYVFNLNPTTGSKSKKHKSGPAASVLGLHNKVQSMSLK